MFLHKICLLFNDEIGVKSRCTSGMRLGVMVALQGLHFSGPADINNIGLYHSTS